MPGIIHDPLELALRVTVRVALRLLDAQGDITPFGITFHEPDASTRASTPATTMPDATFEELHDLILLELRSRAAQGGVLAASLATRLDRLDDDGFALAIQVASPAADIATFAPCTRTADGWTLEDGEMMQSPLIPAGLWWPRDPESAT